LQPHRASITLPRYPFSRSYGAILPSSFARVHSFASVSSTFLPVSVYGTVTYDTPVEAFLGSEGSASLWPKGPPRRSSEFLIHGFASVSSSVTWISYSTTRLCLPLCVTPSVIRITDGTGILTRFPSTTPPGLALGPTYPGRIFLPQESLDFRRLDFSSKFMLLMPALSLLIPPTKLTLYLLQLTECSPTVYLLLKPAASVVSLSPGTF
jgi:hypothetical protein